ncbi:hypothetical protein AB0B27_14395 [Micromonospora rifamycinica]|uniref:hypothetical protein n=1 Tax=Micromonospora rifamycinica TaxID=291594 RepID=UPI0033F9D4F0
MTIRTQEEIVTRVWALRANREDIFGFREEVLVEALDLDYARQVITPRHPEAWTRRIDHETYARDYLRFAVGKIIDHRGNSASRSVDKLGELAWLLGRDDIVAGMDRVGYPMYGAPKVKAFADGFGWLFLDDFDGDTRVALARMAEGQQCDPQGCERGCAD